MHGKGASGLLRPPRTPGCVPAPASTAAKASQHHYRRNCQRLSQLPPPALHGPLLSFLAPRREFLHARAKGLNRESPKVRKREMDWWTCVSMVALCWVLGERMISVYDVHWWLSTGILIFFWGLGMAWGLVVVKQVRYTSLAAGMRVACMTVTGLMGRTTCDLLWRSAA